MRKTLTFLCALTALGLQACSGDDADRTAAKQADTAPPAAASRAQAPTRTDDAPASAPLAVNAVAASPTALADCPGSDFKSFLKAYRGSLDIQRKFTDFPLNFSYTDFDAEDTPRIHKKQSLKETQFPLLHGNGDVDPGEVTIARKGKVVVVTEPTGEYSTSDFRFVERDGCWHLTAIEDNSAP